MTEDIAVLRLVAGRYELSYPSLGLIIRGAHAEWVLEAAAEIVGQTERLRAESKVEELVLLKDLGESSDVEVDSARYDMNARFESVPQCLVSMGENDYRWVAPAGRVRGSNRPMQRLHDMSLTRNDSFLHDQADA